MAKIPDIRQTEAWKESKMQMVSILTRKMRKVKVDQHIMIMDVNESQMEIHSLVSWFSTLSFQKKTSFQTNLIVMSSIARVTETKSAINFSSTCVVYSFLSSSHWDWFFAFYLQQIVKIKKWL